MSHLSSALVLKALDGLTLRSEVTAENIANAGTPNYRPLRVSFERALAAAATRGPDAVRAVRPQITFDDSAASQTGLRLDLELTTASATALRYAALAEILARQSERDGAALAGNA